jgi:8-oxo-dGTP diphosphatase
MWSQGGFMIRKVTAAIITKDGKILIAQKGPADKRANKWEFPGGKIDQGETPEECLVREMMEEFEIGIRVGDFFVESLFSYSEGQLLVLAYFCTWIDGILHPTEHADYKWVEAQELNQYDFVPSDMAIARKLQQEYRK